MTKQLEQPASLEQKIAQKIMLDFRYFNDAEDRKSQKHPMVRLPDAIAQLITDHCLGGIILFKENLRDIEQIATLTNDMQQAAKVSALGLPLFLSVDHEGGRVTRLPEQLATNLTGNMSIGATYSKHGTAFAALTAEVLAKELSVLGINVNHAPVVDVNADEQNPVINVRSFSDNPDIVADLAAVQAEQQQKYGVISTLKHFPGHGNTSIDSHTGLPCINHSKEVTEKYDLGPFRKVLSRMTPGMIMTAHIQYPVLDRTPVSCKNGETIIAPATMSRRIIHGLLRDEYNYQGIVITDALDMAGISDYFNATDAVINCFKADVDIALMPIRIRNIDDLGKLPRLISKVAQAVANNELNEDEITASFQRICRIKQSIDCKNEGSFDERCTEAKLTLGCQQHKDIEHALAENALTVLKGQERISELFKNNSSIHIIMPQRQICDALRNEMQDINDSLSFSQNDLALNDKSTHYSNIKNADIIIAGHIYPKQSAVELGGIEDIEASSERLDTIKKYKLRLISTLEFAKKNNKPVVFISLRTPYDTAYFSSISDIIIACYAYNFTETNPLAGPSYRALAKLLNGSINATGTSPVKIGQYERFSK